MSALPAPQTRTNASAELACGHSVQFYQTDTALIEAVSRHLCSGLLLGDVAIVIATKPHRQALTQELRLRGVDVNRACKSGHYIDLDAQETLDRFMLNGSPDEQKFAEIIGGVVARAEAAAAPGRRVLAFGEMVALLWAQGNGEATIRLEQLWNELAERHSFFLMCGYPLSAFDRLDHRRLFFNICGEHSHINPAESYPAQGSEKQRRRRVAQLQQKTQALENEIRLSQERLLLVQNVSGTGTWELDLVDDTVSFSSTASRLLGLANRRMQLDQMLDLIHYSGDREALIAGLQGARRGRKEFAVQFRISRAGRTRVLDIRGKTIYNGGSPLVLGVLSDVTPQKKAS